MVIESYKEAGMKFEEAFEDLTTRINDPENAGRPKKAAPPPDDGASLAMLSALMAGSDFKGAGR